MVTRGAILPYPRAGGRISSPRAVILFVLIGHVPTVLLLAQLGMLYLAVLDMREEDDLDFQVKVWWVLLVLLFNVLGLIAEKVWVTARRRRR